MRNRHFLIIFSVLFCAFVIKMFINGLSLPEALASVGVLGTLIFFKHNEKVLIETEVQEFKRIKEAEVVAFKEETQSELAKEVKRLENENGKLQLQQATAVRRY